jgi:hypothetical protein
MMFFIIIKDLYKKKGGNETLLIIPPTHLFTPLKRVFNPKVTRMLKTSIL